MLFQEDQQEFITLMWVGYYPGSVTIKKYNLHAEKKHGELLSSKFGMMAEWSNINLISPFQNFKVSHTKNVNKPDFELNNSSYHSLTYAL